MLSSNESDLIAYRRLAVGLGLAVLGWQVVNLGLGRFRHEYLIADLVASAVLIVTGWRASAPGMLAGFAMLGGVLLAATTGKLVVGGAHPGTIAAAIGIVPCVVGMVGIGIKLARP
jgi:hypothetical protein